MKRKFIQCLCLTLFGVLLLPGRAARALESRIIFDYYWHNTPRAINVYCPMSSTDRSYVQSAMNTWNAVKSTTGSYPITYQFTSNVNAEGKLRWEPRSDSDFIAYTDHTYHGSYLTGFTIWINSTKAIGYGAVSGKYDFQTVVVHELGHGIAIRHCHEEDTICPWAGQGEENFVMNYKMPKGKTRRTLQSYDINSFRGIY